MMILSINYIICSRMKQRDSQNYHRNQLGDHYTEIFPYSYNIQMNKQKLSNELEIVQYMCYI